MSFDQYDKAKEYEKEGYHKAIALELAEADGRRIKVLGMVEDVALAQEVIDKFCAKEWDARVSIGLDFGSMQGVLIHIDNVKSIADIAPIRRELRERGFPAPKPDDYAELKRRSYLYAREGKPQFAVMVFLRGENAVCEYVQVGTKVEPVYELRCGGVKVAEGNEDERGE
jgi:hypothetical protein